jgi:hypothetical protein
VTKIKPAREESVSLGAKMSPDVPEVERDGWEVGRIFAAQSGQPFTAITAPDLLGLGSADGWDSPDVTPGCKTANPGNDGNSLDLNCYTLLPAATSFASKCAPFSGTVAPPPCGQVYCANLFGFAVRNSAKGPDCFNFNFSVFKNNNIKMLCANIDGQVRAEFFNSLNHTSSLEPMVETLQATNLKPNFQL